MVKKSIRTTLQIDTTIAILIKSSFRVISLLTLHTYIPPCLCLVGVGLDWKTLEYVWDKPLSLHQYSSISSLLLIGVLRCLYLALFRHVSYYPSIRSSRLAFIDTSIHYSLIHPFCDYAIIHTFYEYFYIFLRSHSALTTKFVTPFHTYSFSVSKKNLWIVWYNFKKF